MMDPIGRRTGRSVRGRRFRRASVVLVGAVAALAPGMSVTAAAPQTFAVSVDGHTAENKSAFLAYYPKEVSVHPGDTVQFDLADSGEPHTVTFGTLVDSGVAALKTWTDPNTRATGPGQAAGPAARRARAMRTRSPRTHATSRVVTRRRTRRPPVRATDQPAFDGTQSFYNSGWLAPDAPFTVTLRGRHQAGHVSLLLPAAWRRDVGQHHGRRPRDGGQEPR